MARKYTGNIQQSATFIIDTPKPLDDRLVVSTINDLYDFNVWAVDPDDEDSDVVLYNGILVAVVEDTIDNNGLYMLLRKNKYQKQSWDDKASNYDQYGWFKINGSTIISGSPIKLDTSTENEEHSPGSFALNNDGEYYISTLNGGTF